MPPALLYALELIGTVVFAISGALTAGRRRFDIMGVTLVACVVGVGGGTLRDLLLGIDPVFWVREPLYLGLCVATGVAFFFLGSRWQFPYGVFLWADAAGLGVFTIIGTKLALAAGVHGGIAVAMGVCTGVGGGFMRDMICGEVPLILRKETLYATPVLAGAVVLVILDRYFQAGPVATLACLGVVLGLRLAAIRWNLRLPVFASRRDT